MAASQSALASQKYRPIMELGHGGTSDVYLAVAKGLGGFNKLVVLKALKRSLAAEDPSREMFLGEARICARLNHPNIVQVNEVTEQDGLPIIVMEYLEGRSLHQVLHQAGANFPVAFYLRAIADALGGLHYAHELTDFDGTPLGMIHRDISPHNIFITFDGRVKLLDFGIAKLGMLSGETKTGVIKGKLHYMSPEQVIGEKKLDRRSDLFAVGIMLWEAATGQRLWGDLSETAIIARLIDEDIPSPRTVKSCISEKLERVIMRALARDRDARYSHADELRKDVESCISEMSGSLSTRELGRYISSMFTDARSQTRRIVDLALKNEADLPVSLDEFSGPSLTGLGGGTATTQVVAAMARKKAEKRRWAVVASAAALLVVGGLVAWRVVALQAQQASSAEVAAAPAAPAPKPEVRLRLTAYPADAKVYLDDKLVETNPFEAVYSADGSRHVVRAEADGYAPATREVRLHRDAEVILNLQPLPAAEAEPTAPTAPAQGGGRRGTGGRPQPQGGAATPDAEPPAPAEKPAAANSDCTPPYYLDERGVKKYKPQCL
jgi:serine/threonine-protein kinase